MVLRSGISDWGRKLMINTRSTNFEEMEDIKKLSQHMELWGQEKYAED